MQYPLSIISESDFIVIFLSSLEVLSLNFEMSFLYQY